MLFEIGGKRGFLTMRFSGSTLHKSSLALIKGKGSCMKTKFERNCPFLSQRRTSSETKSCLFLMVLSSLLINASLSFFSFQPQRDSAIHNYSLTASPNSLCSKTISSLLFSNTQFHFSFQAIKNKFTHHSPLFLSLLINAWLSTYL